MVMSGLQDSTSYDHGDSPRFFFFIPSFNGDCIVLNSEYASMLALEFGKNPVVDDEAAFDIYPS